MISIDNLGKAWTGGSPGKGEYIDLERSSAGGDSQTQLRFSDTLVGSPTKSTH